MKRLLSPQPINIVATIAVLRIVIGAMMIYHGWEVWNAAQMTAYANWDMFKNSSSPLLMVYTGKAAELLCGVLLAVGLFTRIAAIVLISTMCYITFAVGKGIVWYGDQHLLLLLLFGVLFFFSGASKWSIDQILFKQKSKYTSY